MVVEPVVELRRDPRPDSPTVRTVYAGDLIDVLDGYELDSNSRPEWQQIAVGPSPVEGFPSRDTLWAPSRALISHRDTGPGTLRSDLSLFEARTGVLAKRIGAAEFLQNHSKIRDSTWVSATYGAKPPGQLFTVLAFLRWPRSYLYEAEGRQPGAYDSLYSRPYYRAIVRPEFTEQVAEARIRIFLTRRFHSDSSSRIQAECIPLADTTVIVGGYHVEFTKLIPQDAFWSTKRGAVWRLTLVFLAEPRAKDWLLPPIAERMLVGWPAGE